MKFKVKHEICGRSRIHVLDNGFTFKEADIYEYVLLKIKNITKVKIYEATGDITFYYDGRAEDVYKRVASISLNDFEIPKDIVENSSRELSVNYKEKLIVKITRRYLGKIFVPSVIRYVYSCFKAVPYVLKGIKCVLNNRVEVPLLDAIAITISLFRRDFKTASQVMFLLGIGELLEEWTHKKSVSDLAKTMSINVNEVWLVTEKTDVLVSINDVNIGDKIRVHMGHFIPLDGEVLEGEGVVNQASLTGESEPVRKGLGSSVYAGTVLEEGDIVIRVTKNCGATHYEKVISMIEETEKIKSKASSRAEHLADRLVPYTLLGTGITYLLTRNITKTMSVLMVDFSCALKLAMPITVLTTIKQARECNIAIKGGKFIEEINEATTIVFDKTGTLTKACPKVKKVIAYTEDYSEDELLTIAACLEEHFPHSIANAVVVAAQEKNLIHEEMHSKVEYIVAHGIVSSIDDKRVVIGSHHFVVEDEKCKVDEKYREKYDLRPMEYSHLYMAIDNVLIAIICIEDPIRSEAKEVISELRKVGFNKVVMMTGDSRRTAEVVAKSIGIDEFYAEVLPEEKAAFVTKERELGNKVAMVGDGINDSPALSAANVGIAISDGSAIAREIADITIMADSLYELITLKKISKKMQDRINSNYFKIIGINGGLIAFGVTGVIAPTTSALVHNASTIAIGLNSMTDYII